MEFDYDKVKKAVLRKYAYFGSILSNVNIQIVDNDTLVMDKNGQSFKVGTAATDGRSIIINKDFAETLDFSQQVGTLAHELSHMALKHVERSKDKNQRLWNIATDAIINHQIKEDGLDLPEGHIDIEGAFQYNAEELYAMLLQRQQQREQDGGMGNQDDSSNGSNGNAGGEGRGNSNANNNVAGGANDDDISKSQDTSSNGDNGQSTSNDNNNSTDGETMNKTIDDLLDSAEPDNHNMWDSSKEKKQDSQDQSGDKDKLNKKQGADTNSKTESKPQGDSQPIDENKLFDEMRRDRTERAKQAMDKIKQACTHGGDTQNFNLTNIGTAKPILNWKKQLVKMLELEDEVWGHKFSDAENGWRARIEDVEFDEDAETEIIVDTSGSVSDELLRSFLQQAKNVLKESKLKVGMFSTDFYGWNEIKEDEDIDKLDFKGRGGTNFNAASEAFTKRKDVNKICFTDGQDDGDAGIVDKRKDIVWVSFENMKFKPDNGKVLYVTPDEIMGK